MERTYLLDRSRYTQKVWHYTALHYDMGYCHNDLQQVSALYSCEHLHSHPHNDK